MRVKRKLIDRRVIDLSVAWLKNEITYSELCRQMNRKINGNTYIIIARALKVAHRSKLL